MIIRSYLVNPIILALIGLSVLYWAISPLLNSVHVIEFLDGVIISFSAFVSLMYGKRFLRGILHYKSDVLYFIIAGIAGGWCVNALDRLWRLIARVLHYPDDMINSLVIGYFLLMMAFFAGLHLTVRGASENDVHKAVSTEATWLIITAAIMGCAIGAVAVSLDTGWLILKEFQ